MNRVLAVLLTVFALGCPAPAPVPIPCRSNANCPSGYGCNPSGVCEHGIPGSSAEVLAITPGTANVAIGTSVRFVATVDGAEVAVAWTLDGPGSIGNDGTYSAPATMPAAPAQATLHAARTDASQVAGTAMAFIVARNPEPALTTVAPNALSAGSADTTLQLDGSGFVGVSQVQFETASLTPFETTATTIKVVVPASALSTSGAKSVRVINPAPGGGSSTPLTVTLSSPTPTATSVAPTSAVAGATGATFQVTGTGFTGDTALRLDGSDVTVTARTATTLTGTLGAAQLATPRAATLSISNPAPGGAVTLPFDVLSAVPTISTMNPASVAAGATSLTVTVSGTGFSAGTTVTASSTALTVTPVSDTQLTVTLPTASLAAAQVLDLVATNPAPGGGASAGASFTVTNPAPVLVSLSQAAVPVGSAAFTLTLSGGGFVGASSVYWDTTALATTRVSASQLQAAVPASFLATPAQVSITVQNPAPGGGTSAAQTFRVDNPAPSITTITPTTAVSGGAALTLTVAGASFVPQSVVYLGSTALATTYSSAVSLSAAVPAAAILTGGAQQVTVRTPAPGGGTSNAATFTINNPAASLGSLTPANALSGSGDLPLTINGVGFVSGASVTFNGTSLTATVVSSSQVTTTVPAALLTRARTVTVTANNPAPLGGSNNTLAFRIDAVVRTLTGGTGEGGPAKTASLTRTYSVARNPVTQEIYFPQMDRHIIWRIDAAGNLQRVAGTGVAGFSGDTGPATAAAINSPRVLTFDAVGNLYFSDGGNQRIRKIDTTGTITTIGGTGVCDATGDNGVATSAAIGDVWDLKVNGTDLYAAQCGCNGHRVRKIAASGTVTTVAGTGVAGSTGDTGLATAATLNCAMALAFDSTSQLYIAEWNGSRVRKVATNGIISTVTGNGVAGNLGDGALATAAQVANPRSLLFDASDNLYIATYWGYRIRKIDAVSGNISLVAGTTSGKVSVDGTAVASALIGHPTGLFFDDAGDLNFLTVQEGGSDLNAVMKLSGGTVISLAGRSLNTTISNNYLYRPFGIAVDAVGNRYISEHENDRILKVDVSGSVTVVAGNGIRGFSGEGTPATQAMLNGPEGLWLDSSGNLYFADSNNYRVRKVDPAGTITTVAGGAPYPTGCPVGPPTTVPSGAGTGYNCIGDDYFATAAVVLYPRFIIGDNQGNLYLTEYDVGGTVNRGNRVRKVVLATGIITTVAGGTAMNTNNCTFTGDGALAINSTLCAPAGLALSPAGDLYVADSSNRRLRKVNLVSTPVGNISTVAGTGVYNSTGNGGPAPVATFRRPFSLVFDGLGSLLVSDIESQNVRIIDPTQFISVAAGLGPVGWFGDGGAARDAYFYSPCQVAVSADSSLIYIADYNNDRVRLVGP